LLIDREDFVEDNEDGVEIIDCAGFFFINYIDRGTEGFAGDGEIEGGEDGVGIADCENLFFADDVGRGAEGFVGDGEDGVEIVDCVGFFLVSYAGRGAVSPHFANFVIVIAAAKTASMYRFWVYRINLESLFNNYSWGIVISLIISSKSISYSKKILNR
jgi:hypothetical protein